jgi:hypothetical protein
MLRLLATEEIQTLLGRVPELVRLFEEKDSAFVEGVKEWLMQAELRLKDNQLIGVSEIAGLRLMLIAAEQGAVPEGLNLPGNPSRRRIKSVTAADVLRKAAKQVALSIASFVGQASEAERLIRQMLPLAEKKGLIPEVEGPARGEALAAIWEGLESDADLASIALHVCGLVGKQDALILLDRCLAWLFITEGRTGETKRLQLTKDPVAYA